MKTPLVIIVIFCGLGCGRRQEEPAPQAADDKKAPGVNDGKKPMPQGFARKLRRPQALNELRQIAALYIVYHLNNQNRPPKTLKVFTDTIKREAGAEVEALENGWYLVNLKANLNAPGIIVYEAEPDEAGMVYAARTDGSVDSFPMDEVRRLVGK